MQLVKKKEQFGEILFGIGILIHLLIMIIGYGEWAVPFHGRLMQVAFVMFGLKILTTFYSGKEWIAMIVMGILGVLSYAFAGDEYVVSVVVMIFAAKNVDMRRVCKWILWFALSATIMTALLSMFGIGGMAVDIRDYGRGGEEARWCLGFGHANNFHGTVWYIAALFIYLFHRKLDWKHYVALTIVNFWVFYFTRSKGGLIALQILIVAAVLFCYVKPLMKQVWMYVCGELALLGVMVVSLVSVTIKWDASPILLFLDKIFTGRINLAYQHAHISKWQLFSRAGEFGDPVDNGWVTIFWNYGYIIGIAFVLFHAYLIYRIWKEKDGVLLAVVVTCIFYTFMEATYTINSAYLLSNLSYIAAMILMAGKKELKNESEQLEG